MSTTVSIVLYACSVYFSGALGVICERFKNNKADKHEGRSALFCTLAPFVLAVILQVAA